MLKRHYFALHFTTSTLSTVHSIANLGIRHGKSCKWRNLCSGMKFVMEVYSDIRKTIGKTHDKRKEILRINAMIFLKVTKISTLFSSFTCLKKC